MKAEGRYAVRAESVIKTTNYYSTRIQYTESFFACFIDFCVLARAKEAAKTDKKIKRMYNTVSHWRKERKDAREKLRDVHSQINPGSIRLKKPSTSR